MHRDGWCGPDKKKTELDVLMYMVTNVVTNKVTKRVATAATTTTACYYDRTDSRHRAALDVCVETAGAGLTRKKQSWTCSCTW